MIYLKEEPLLSALGRLVIYYLLTWKLEPCFFSQDQDNLEIELNFMCLSFSTCKQFPIKIV